MIGRDKTDKNIFSNTTQTRSSSQPQREKY